jgi:hypothetical protein
MARIGHLLPRHGDQVPESVLSAGVALTSYRLGHLDGDAAWQVFLLSGGEDTCWLLGEFSSRQEAIDAVNGLRRLIIWLNVHSEGMHVVEHILLRFAYPTEPVAGPTATDFFSLRTSVVFPGWTARFRDQRFRQLAKETVCLNCPAHIVPEVLWLGFEDMQEFERLQEDWLNGLSGEPPVAGDMAAASTRLVEFLGARRGADCWDIQPTTPSASESGNRSDVSSAR